MIGETDVFSDDVPGFFCEGTFSEILVVNLTEILSLSSPGQLYRRELAKTAVSQEPQTIYINTSLAPFEDL